MAEETKIVGIYEIKIENGPALRAFEDVKKRLDDTKARIRDLNKENKDLIKAENEVTAAVKLQGAATSAQAKQLEAVRNRRSEVNKAVSEAVIVEKALSGQARELTNDLSGLTENNLRFRDKMAQATLEAIKQSGVLQELSRREKEVAADLNLVSASLQKNEQQLADLNVAYSKGEKTTEQYAQEQAELNRQIEAGKAANTLLKSELQQVAATTATLDQRISDLNKELNAGKINTEEYRKALSKIEDETRKAGAATASLTEKFDGFVGRQGAELKSTLNGIALQYVGIGAAIYGAQRIIGDAIDTVVEFDRALSNIRALGGEYASNIEAIGEAAKTAGINFGFSAKESLDAVEALAKAGVSVTDILGGALPGALTLAAAGSISVGEAAETASKAMTQFGLAGEDIPKLADLLAAAAATATGDVGDFNAALNQSGLVAAQLNIPIEEAIGALTAFASAGLLGSDAGTSFRTMLLRLQNPTEESAALLKQYGIDAFDLQGNFVGLESLAGQLQERLGGLTQEQRSAALAQIFGSDAIRAANVLYIQGAEGVAKYTAQVDKQGFAQNVAAEKTNNLSGSINRLSAQYDAFILSLENGNGVIARSFSAILQGFERDLKVLTNAEGLGDIFKIFTPGGSQIEAARIQMKEAREELIRIREEAGPSKRSIGELEEQLKKLTDLRDAFNKQGKTEAAQEGDPMIASLERLIAARKKLEEIQSKNAKDAPSEDAAKYESVSQAVEKLKLKLQDLLQERNQLNVLDAEGIAAKDREIAAVEKKIAALNGEKTASAAARAETKNVAGSIADLNEQISTLQAKQGQTNESAQFQAYQQQIDELERSIERIKNASATPLIDEVFGKNLEAQPTTVDPGTPMIDELEVQAIADLEEMRMDSRVNEIQGIKDFNLERLILEEEFAQGIIASRAELDAKLGELNQERNARDIELAQQGLNSIASLADGILAVDQAVTDGRVAELQKRIDAEKKAGNDTTELERQQRELLVEQERKAFNTKRAVALAQITIDTAKAISSLTAASSANPANAVTFGAAGAAQFAAGLVSIGAQIAQAAALLSQKAPGFASGGQIDPSGVVRSDWGTPVTRGNGDNVLVRTRAGFVTLKTGEVVLNEQQQQRAKQEAGADIFGRIGVPGFQRFGGSTMARHYLNIGYAEGGVVGLVTPRPAPSSVVQSQLVSQFTQFADRPIYTRITEINDVQNSVNVTEQMATL